MSNVVKISEIKCLVKKYNRQTTCCSDERGYVYYTAYKIQQRDCTVSFHFFLSDFFFLKKFFLRSWEKEGIPPPVFRLYASSHTPFYFFVFILSPLNSMGSKRLN